MDLQVSVEHHYTAIVLVLAQMRKADYLSKAPSAGSLSTRPLIAPVSKPVSFCALPRLERYFNVVPRGPAFFSRRSPVLERAGKRQFIVNRCLVSIAAHGSVRRSCGNAGNVVK